MVPPTHRDVKPGLALAGTGLSRSPGCRCVALMNRQFKLEVSTRAHRVLPNLRYTSVDRRHGPLLGKVGARSGTYAHGTPGTDSPSLARNTLYGGHTGSRARKGCRHLPTDVVAPGYAAARVATSGSVERAALYQRRGQQGVQCGSDVAALSQCLLYQCRLAQIDARIHSQPWIGDMVAQA